MMVAINFQPRFAAIVKAGSKRQTVRRTARCKPGDRLQLYTGQRTKACKKLGEAVCLSVVPCSLGDDGVTLGGFGIGADAFARADGFRDFAEMLAWFRVRHGADEFDGFLIRW